MALANGILAALNAQSLSQSSPLASDLFWPKADGLVLGCVKGESGRSTAVQS